MWQNRFDTVQVQLYQRLREPQLEDLSRIRRVSKVSKVLRVADRSIDWNFKFRTVSWINAPRHAAAPAKRCAPTARPPERYNLKSEENIVESPEHLDPDI